MSGLYRQLLDAAIQHLEDLKARGVRFVPVSADTVTAAMQPARAVTPGARPVPSRGAQPAPRPVAPNGLRELTTMPRKGAIASVPTAPGAGGPAAIQKSLLEEGPVGPALEGAARVAAFAELRQRVEVCVKCPHLANSRTQVVFGVGNIFAELMFVGEAPGADEDAQGEPFVGKAGQLLTKIIAAMGLSREQVYIGNILKCRPDTPGQGAGNRKPTLEEMQTCIPYLHEQIDLIRPKVLVALGATAVEGLHGKTAGITRLRGTWHTYRGIPLMPTYHPAYLLRNQSVGEKRRVWEDMLKVMEKLGLPISQKQRNHFLKAG